MIRDGSSLDVVVIGAGAGGLSAAVSLARSGLQVAVVERNSVAGGNCTSFRSGPYRFDLALHQLSGVDAPGGIAGEVLKEYGIHSRMKFERIEPFMTIVMPDAEYNLSGTWDRLRDDLGDRFPESCRDLERSLARIRQDYEDTFLIQRLAFGRSPVVESVTRTVSARNQWTLPLRLPSILSAMKRTGDAYLGRTIRDPKLWSVLTASWPYLGLPPSRISGFFLSEFLATQHREATFYPIGSSQALADGLVDELTSRGGRIHLDAEARRITIERGRATGVDLADGSRLNCRAVVSNIDATKTFTELIGPEFLPSRTIRRVGRMRPSVGPFRLFLGLDYEVHRNGFPNHEYLFYESYDHEETYRKLLRGSPAVMSAYSPSRLDPGSAPVGHSTLILLTFFPWRGEGRDWREHHQEIEDEMIAIVERKLPDVRKHIRVRELLTPAGLMSRTNVRDGAMYGWDCAPDQAVARRLAPLTPIPNVFLAGHWTQPGPGVTTAIVSGWMTAQLVRKKLRHQVQ